MPKPNDIESPVLLMRIKSSSPGLSAETMSPDLPTNSQPPSFGLVVILTPL